MTSNVSELMMQARELSLQERRELIRLLNDTVADEANTQEHSILELAGLGAEIWEGIDPQEYIRQLRSEWDDRP
jgi:hypothetical protein